jgi:methylthioribose-1-phosphate isomerase
MGGRSVPGNEAEVGHAAQNAVRAVRWEAGSVVLLDQRRLPGRVEHVRLTEASEVAAAIVKMVVRGAPAIGIAAAYAVVLAAQKRIASSSSAWRRDIEADLTCLEAARPTAVNLRWAVARMRRLIARSADMDAETLLEEARRIHREDIEANQQMGALGSALLGQGVGVLTHCNAGALATGGFGTALGVIRAAHREGRLARVYAGETRPWLQGVRLTAWELAQDGIAVTVIADSAAAYLMRREPIDWVIVGADRVAANGDVANKIGTYGLAVLARQHDVGFMVVAPSSTLDPSSASGADIPLETRAPDELLGAATGHTAGQMIEGWNPVFDVTPAELIDVLVTEKGVIRRPDGEKLAGLIGEFG